MAPAVKEIAWATDKVYVTQRTKRAFERTPTVQSALVFNPLADSSKMHRTARPPAVLRRVLSRLALGALLSSVSACQMASPAAPSETAGEVASLAAVAAYSLEIAQCADEINRYRSLVGRPALRRSAALEAFAATAAQTDGTAHVAHQHFRVTNGSGIAMAETQILWWRDFAVKAVVQKGLAQMWQLGPGGEHYEILVGPYTEVGCGIFVNAGEVTISQDFR
jgi:hypothetical protein